MWELLSAEGVLAATEELMRISHEDVKLSSYEGVSIKARARSFEVEGESVEVRGSVRVSRPDGSFAETKLRWSYRFRDCLVDEITWQPRAGD